MCEAEGDADPDPGDASASVPEPAAWALDWVGSALCLAEGAPATEGGKVARVAPVLLAMAAAPEAAFCSALDGALLLTWAHDRACVEAQRGIAADVGAIMLREKAIDRDVEIFCGLIDAQQAQMTALEGTVERIARRAAGMEPAELLFWRTAFRERIAALRADIGAANHVKEHVQSCMAALKAEVEEVRLRGAALRSYRRQEGPLGIFRWPHTEGEGEPPAA